MGEYLRKVFTQIGEFFSSLSPMKRVYVILTALAVAGGMSYLLMWANETSYRPLMTNLNAEDATKIIRVLRDKKIPFRVDPTGRNIEIPPDFVDQYRLELATMGLPETSTVGYEIFDHQALGTTSFVQKVNQKRAQEGELVRTISAIHGVKRARVHLVIPEKSTFIEDQRPPTASVVLDLLPGIRLSDKQIYGVGNLVANSVEGLDIEDVIIIDASGKTLSKNVKDPVVAQTASQLDFQRKLEEEFEKRIVTVLQPVVGEGKVVATVSADIDFSQSSESQTLYDSEGSAVLSKQTDSTAMNGSRPVPRGVAGVKSNTPGEPPPENTQAEVSSKTDRTKEITNFRVPQTVRTTKHAAGDVKKLSVAVVVDGKSVMTKDKDGNLVTKIEPWPADKLAEFEKIIARTTGIDEKRGDKLEIKNIEFAHEDFTQAEAQLESMQRRQYFQTIITYLVIATIVILFFLFVVRPFIKWVTENTIDSVDSFLPQTIEELEKMQKNSNLPGLEETIPELPDQIDPQKVEGQMIKERIVTLVDSNPHKAALVLRDWIRDKRGEQKADTKSQTA